MATHTHVPTKVGIIVLAIMLAGIITVFTQINETQDVRSRASGPTPASACVTQFRGTCQYTNNPCAGGYISGYCPGPSNYKCCKPAPTPLSSRYPTPLKSSPTPKTNPTPSKCQSQLRGTCQSTSTYCKGKYAKGYCPGAANIQCCY